MPFAIGWLFDGGGDEDEDEQEVIGQKGKGRRSQGKKLTSSAADRHAQAVGKRKQDVRGDPEASS